jgi:hypothetical protein
MRAWSSKRPSFTLGTFAPASGLVLAHWSGGHSAEGRATVPTIPVPPLPLPVLATVIEGVGDLDQFAAVVRVLDEEEDARFDEEATRTLLDFARSLRLASVRLMTDATTIEEVAVRLFGREELNRG